MNSIEFLQKTYGVEVKNEASIQSGVANTNVLITSDHGKYIFKTYKTKSFKEASNELGILEFLSEKSFPSPLIRKTNLGKLITLYDNKPSTLLYYIEGTVLDIVSDVILEKIGEQMGALHILLKNNTFKDAHPRWEPKDMITILEKNKETLKRNGFEKEGEYVLSELRSITYPQNLPQGMTHQDVKPENIIISADKKIYFLDFGNAFNGTLLYDALTTIIWTCFEKGTPIKGFIESYLKGYEQKRPLTNEEREHFQDALMFRILRESVIWMWLYADKKAKEKTNYFIQLYKSLKRKTIII
jgi:Ser/Thr protein kinase RdoA (MazF antagonist)